jgi:hypothetical protein
MTSHSKGFDHFAIHAILDNSARIVISAIFGGTVLVADKDMAAIDDKRIGI